MWLKKAVGLSMIITCVLLNGLVILGLFVPDKAPAQTGAIETPAPLLAVTPPPTVTITAIPSSITAGSSSALSWTTTGNATGCIGSGNWSGPKTPFGAESTGRLSTAGNYTYTIECKNAGGSVKTSAVVSVGGVVAPPKSIAVTTTNAGAVYCGGRSPCYGASQVASHSSSGNCWGYNLDRVINISGFDAGFHQPKSGISSIAISAICGKNLAPALSGQVSADGQTRNHNATSKQNADKNMIPYFVGYFDSSKP